MISPPARRDKYDASGRNSKVLVKKLPKLPKSGLASAQLKKRSATVR